MSTHLQKTGKIQSNVTYSSAIYYEHFLVDTLRFLAGVSTLNSQKLTERIYRKVEGYSYHLVLIL